MIMRKKSVKGAAKVAIKPARTKRGKAIKPTESNLDQCAHCGGMLKHEDDWVSCVMCGRLANHRCATCMAANDTRVAAA